MNIRFGRFTPFPMSGRSTRPVEEARNPNGTMVFVPPPLSDTFGADAGLATGIHKTVAAHGEALQSAFHGMAITASGITQNVHAARPYGKFKATGMDLVAALLVASRENELAEQPMTQPAPVTAPKTEAPQADSQGGHYVTREEVHSRFQSLRNEMQHHLTALAALAQTLVPQQAEGFKKLGREITQENAVLELFLPYFDLKFGK